MSDRSYGQPNIANFDFPYNRKTAGNIGRGLIAVKPFPDGSPVWLKTVSYNIAIFVRYLAIFGGAKHTHYSFLRSKLALGQLLRFDPKSWLVQIWRRSTEHHRANIRGV